MDPDSGATRLREAGFRATRPRLALLAVLDAARVEGEHLPVSEIIERVRVRAGDVSHQAVYDSLHALHEAALVRMVETAGSPTLWETRVGDNHHHLVCRSCGRTVDVDCADGAAPCLQPAESRGFVVDEAEVVFWGTCPACAAPAPAV